MLILSAKIDQLSISYRSGIRPDGGAMPWLNYVRFIYSNDLAKSKIERPLPLPLPSPLSPLSFWNGCAGVVSSTITGCVKLSYRTHCQFSIEQFHT